MQFFALLICTAIFALASAVRDETVVVNAPVGRVRGSLMTSRLGRTIYSFRGVRFAEPPVGDRRFKVPLPIAPWTNIFDATQEGPSCPQIGGEIQSEDCLRLNVYTTKLPSVTKSRKTENPKRPVIVYFHPGAFYVFSAQSITVGPQYYMDQDIVLVTVNNRLGTLGWVATGDALAPGNLGLKDQVVALRWVQKNIASFGGDPNSVTITGFSAGAWSCVLHMVSPMTKGLFHRTIIMSGSPIYQLPLPTNQTNILKKQAEFVGCPTDSPASSLECLKAKPATELSETLPRFFEWHGDPILIWSPVIEPEIPGVERYLTAQPGDLFRAGKFHQVPVITGVSQMEFGSAILPAIEQALKGNSSIFDEFNSDWERIAPISFYFERDTPRSKEISKELRKFYLHNQPISLNNYRGLSKLYDDAIVSFNAHKFITILARYTTQPIWYYEFTYQGRYSHSVWNDTRKPFGVVHHDDLLYIFYDKYFPYFEKTDPEYLTVQRLTSMWANFAKTGHPIPSNNALFADVTWTPFTSENKKYLDIGNELAIKTHLKGDRMAEFDRIFPYPEVTGRASN